MYEKDIAKEEGYIIETDTNDEFCAYKEGFEGVERTRLYIQEVR